MSVFFIRHRQSLVRTAVGLAFIVSLNAPFPAQAADSNAWDTCFNYLNAKDYRSAKTEAQTLLKKLMWTREEKFSTLICLGRAYLSTGDNSAALTTFFEAQRFSDSTLDNAIVYQYLGKTYLRLDNPSAAELNSQWALKAFKEVGYKKGESITLIDLALIAKDRSDDDKTLALYREILTLDMASEETKVVVLHNTAAILSSREKYFESITLQRQALEIARRLGSNELLAKLKINLSFNLIEIRDFANAEIELTAGLVMIQLIGDKDWEATAYTRFGVLYFKQHRLAEAKKMTQKAIAVSKANGKVNKDAVDYLEMLNNQ